MAAELIKLDLLGLDIGTLLYLEVVIFKVQCLIPEVQGKKILELVFSFVLSHQFRSTSIYEVLVQLCGHKIDK